MQIIISLCDYKWNLTIQQVNLKGASSQNHVFSALLYYTLVMTIHLDGTTFVPKVSSRSYIYYQKPRYIATNN